MVDARALSSAFALCGALAGAGCATEQQKGPTPLFDQQSSNPGLLHRSLGRSLMELREWDRATVELLESSKHDPDSVETHVLLGVVYRERGLIEEGEASLKKAVELDDDNADAHSALGVLYDRLGRDKEAEEQHREAIRLAPERADLHNNLGFSLYLKKKYVEAVACFRAALRFGAGPRTHNNLGFTYGRLGHVSRAFREFRRAGSEAQAFNNIGWVYELLADRERAEEAYKKAVSLDPTMEQARTNLNRLAEHVEGSDGP